MPPSLNDRQRRIVQSAMQAEAIPGVAVAIVDDGEIAAAQGFGYRHLDQRLPMTPGTVIPICSLTKSITATAILQSVERGIISLDEPVRTYLPDLLISDLQTTAKVTPRVLLCHKSGMGRTGHQPPMWNTGPPPYRDRADLVSRLANVRLQTPPNTTWSYCNEGFVILGHLVSAVSGTSLEEYFESRIFRPLEMNDTHTTFDAWRASPDRAHLYERGTDRLTEASLPGDYGVYLSTGGISSTALDLARYQIANMDYANNPVLGAGSLEQMQSISMPFGDTGMGYGLGWHVRWAEGRKVVSHGGGLAGVSTHSLMVPSEGMGVVVLTNLGGANAALIAERLAATLIDKPIFFSDPSDPPRIETNWVVPDSRLDALTGVYRSDEMNIEIDSGRDGIVLTRTVPEGGLETSQLLGIGDDLFMAQGGTRNHGNLVYFVRDVAGLVTSLLAGGHQHWREEGNP